VPAIFFLIPLFGIIALNLPFGKVMRKAAFAFAFALFLIHVSLVLLHHFGSYISAVEVKGAFFNVSFAVDHLTFIMLLSIGIVALASLIVARSTISDERERFNFINILIIAAAGMYGIVMVKDIFTLYVFLEVAAVSAFIMIAIKKDKFALEGAFKYILLSAIATVMMLSSVALLLLLSGDTSFSAIRAALFAPASSVSLVKIAVGTFLAALFIKGGLVPFHGWLPDAYSAAPAPASILLAGIVTKVSGIYTLVRIVTELFGFTAALSGMLMFVGALSILVGAFAALGQVNFKRMLAYSSISQVGYIVIGLGTGTALGIMGAVFHLFNHAIFKSLLFVNSAAVEKETGTIDMEKLGGLSEKMPVTGVTSAIAFLSTSGIPPFAGFWSKLMIIVALWQVKSYSYAVIAVLASILTAAYLVTMQRKVFFGKLTSGLEKTKEAGFGFCAASITLALITTGAGIFFPQIFSVLIEPVKEILVR